MEVIFWSSAFEQRTPWQVRACLCVCVCVCAPVCVRSCPQGITSEEAFGEMPLGVPAPVPRTFEIGTPSREVTRAWDIMPFVELPGQHSAQSIQFVDGCCRPVLRSCCLLVPSG